MRAFIFVSFILFCLKALARIGYLGNNDYPRIQNAVDAALDVGSLIFSLGFALWAAYLLWIM